MGISVQGLRGREVGRQTRSNQLEESFGASQVLEAILPQIAQVYIVWQVLFHEISGCLGEQHLPTVTRAHYARGSMHIQANVPIRCQSRFAGVQTHADT